MSPQTWRNHAGDNTFHRGAPTLLRRLDGSLLDVGPFVSPAIAVLFVLCALVSALLLLSSRLLANARHEYESLMAVTLLLLVSVGLLGIAWVKFMSHW